MVFRESPIERIVNVHWGGGYDVTNFGVNLIDPSPGTISLSMCGGGTTEVPTPLWFSDFISTAGELPPFAAWTGTITGNDSEVSQDFAAVEGCEDLGWVSIGGGSYLQILESGGGALVIWRAATPSALGFIALEGGRLT